jgi:O-6-methylguanine DNA methyltransferase
MRKERITHGVLSVTIELDAHGNLHTVKLPARVPNGMDAASLAGVLQQLAVFPILENTSAPFLQKVWEHMSRIPWGKARTYRELAVTAGSPKASRAVGQACARNPRPLIIPCHRVLAEDGLGGFAYGLEWKAKLLELESEPQPEPQS